jgi:hypothetical protein
MLQPITRMRDDAVSNIMMLYDANGHAIGAWCKRTGRAMLGDAFYVRMDTGAGHEGEDNNKSDYAFVDVGKRMANPTDQTSQIDYRTGNSTRQSVTSVI